MPKTIKDAKKLLRIPIFLLIYSLPIILLEIVFQFVYKDQLRGLTWAVPGFFNQSSRLPYTHLPYLDVWEDSPWVFSTPKEYIRTPVRFRTDSYGSIKPSSFEGAINNKHPYILFCGGSTTEGWASPEGSRVPDKFSKISGIAAVNISLSGKNLSACISSLSRVFDLNLPRPSKIVIATSVNTLAAYGFFLREKSNLMPGSPMPSANKKKRDDIPTREIPVSPFKLKKAIPGLYQFALKLKMSQGPYANMEYGLVSGCCFPSSEINKQYPEFDWLSANVKQGYSHYLELKIASLKALLDKNSFPVDKVIIFVEPNSLKLPFVIGQHDYRQSLFSLAGDKLSFADSADIIFSYDEIYQEQFAQSGFKVLVVPREKLKGEYFYDSVHTTASGSAFIGKFYSENLSALSP